MTDSQYDDLAHEIWAAAQLAPGEGILDGVDRIKTLLQQMLHPLQRSTSMDWIRVVDRLPTADDADESGAVWVYDSVFKSVGSAHFYQAHSAPYYSHWMPKEKRPAPTAPEA